VCHDRLDANEMSLREGFIGEMAEGYLDGRKTDNPGPSENRSASYRHDFASGRDDLARAPRATAATLRQMAEKALSDDLAGHHSFPENRIISMTVSARLSGSEGVFVGQANLSRLSAGNRTRNATGASLGDTALIAAVVFPHTKSCRSRRHPFGTQTKE
jgi:hypothetical protein